MLRNPAARACPRGAQWHSLAAPGAVGRDFLCSVHPSSSWDSVTLLVILSVQLIVNILLLVAGDLALLLGYRINT